MGSFIQPKKRLRPVIIQFMSYVYKKSVKFRQNQNLLFLAQKTCVQASKFKTKCLKILDFYTYTLHRQKQFPMRPVKHELPNKRLKRTKAKKSFFLFENNFFQSFESHQISTQIGIYTHLFLQKSQ